MTAPIVWLVGEIVLILLWVVAAPDWLCRNFDYGGTSPVESATIGLFVFQIFFMWFVPPMRNRRHCTFWLTMFTIITMIAIVRELDLHKLLITTPADQLATHGTPFKMRFLTNSGNPLSDRLLVLGCFTITIAVCGGTLAFFLKRLITGLFKFHPVSWSVGFIGGTGILIQITDRVPSILRKKFDINLSESITTLFTVLEEGQEVLLPIFAVIAILQAHFIYNNDASDAAPLERFKEL